jgi:hypothetical protein
MGKFAHDAHRGSRCCAGSTGPHRDLLNDGKVVATSKTAAFQKAAKVPVHVPLSGKTMEFDGSGRCASGCRERLFSIVAFPGSTTPSLSRFPTPG